MANCTLAILFAHCTYVIWPDCDVLHLRLNSLWCTSLKLFTFYLRFCLKLNLPYTISSTLLVLNSFLKMYAFVCTVKCRMHSTVSCACITMHVTNIESWIYLQYCVHGNWPLYITLHTIHQLKYIKIIWHIMWQTKTYSNNTTKYASHFRFFKIASIGIILTWKS